MQQEALRPWPKQHDDLETVSDGDSESERVSARANRARPFRGKGEAFGAGGRLEFPQGKPGAGL